MPAIFRLAVRRAGRFPRQAREIFPKPDEGRGGYITRRRQ
jgi:hypothetical protein